jgi:cation:H+ antiporter
VLWPFGGLAGIPFPIRSISRSRTSKPFDDGRADAHPPRMGIGPSLALAVAGLVGLAAGAEGLVRGSASLARRVGVSPIVIGLTIVAFGTSTPELVVSLRASLGGQGAIAGGNVIGSNIANIGLILGAAALLGPVAVHVRIIRVEIPLLVAVSVFALVLSMDGTLSRLDGASLFVAFLGWLLWTVRSAVRERPPETELAAASDFPGRLSGSWIVDVLLVLGGLGLLVAGAEGLVRGASRLARAAGVSDAVIGLTLVAIGTSLPELATTLAAARRGESDLAVGNVVGSNLFNLLGILALAGLARPLDLGAIATSDLVVMAGAAMLVWPMLVSGRRLTRIESSLLLGGYAAYLMSLGLSGAPGPSG